MLCKGRTSTSVGEPSLVKQRGYVFDINEPSEQEFIGVDDPGREGNDGGGGRCSPCRSMIC